MSTNIQSCYKLNEIIEFNNIILQLPIKNEQLLVNDYITKNGKKYKIIGYNKDIISIDSTNKYGLIRSVIINSENKVVCYAPPKSYTFHNKYPEFNNLNEFVIEEMIEGTMINVFWDSSIGVCGAWEIATRNTIGGNIMSFDTKTIKSIFLDVCLNSSLDINFLNKDYCYSFVLQHPSLNIVIPITQPKLYLVEVYKIVHLDDKINIYSIPINIIKNNFFYNFNAQSIIYYPKNYSINLLKKNPQDIIDNFASGNLIYSNMGIIIKNIISGERCKINNPNFILVKDLMVENIPLFYQYLFIRNMGKIKQFLFLNPQYKKKFCKFRNILHQFTLNLHNIYKNYYIKKNLIDPVADHYKIHIEKLHDKYINLKQKIIFSIVINYVNKLKPCQQLYAILYPLYDRLNN
jgi:hypothetical protein